MTTTPDGGPGVPGGPNPNNNFGGPWAWIWIIIIIIIIILIIWWCAGGGWWGARNRGVTPTAPTSPPTQTVPQNQTGP